MKRPKLRKASKRITCSKKYRIVKNVAAHKKKLRRAAKNRTGVVHKRNDPGVPNAAPFKEEILREAELRKERAEEERLRQKEKRRNEVDKRRSLEGFQSDALRRQKDFENKTNMMAKMAKDPVLGLANETSRKAYYKEFRKVVENADIIVEVLDARDPLGCRCYEMEKTVLESGINKRIVLLLNKIDLVPKENVEEWLKHLRNEFPTVAFKASTQSQKHNLTQCKIPVYLIDKELLSTTSQCVGADSLMKLLANYCRHDDVETSITVGIVGFPNVGKSSIINSLKRNKSCNVGATPGITKSMQEVTLSKNIKLLDCPGIVMATGSSDVAVILRNCVKVETLDDPITPVAAILSRCNKQQIMMRYNVTNYEDANEFLELLARRKGKLRKGGIPNVKVAAKILLHDWNGGRISYYTCPPLDKRNLHVDAKIVHKMAEEFDWESLEKDNLNALGEVKGCPSQAHSILFQSTGPTPVNMEELEESNDVEIDEDECSNMEDKTNNIQLGEIVINMDDGNNKQEKLKTKNDVKVSRKRISEEGLNDVITEGRNIQANRSLKDLVKQNKKKRKRAEKISDKLGESLISAMDFSNDVDDSYDFDTDLQLPG